MKLFGYDTEGSNHCPNYTTRTVQIFSPTRNKTLVLHKAPGQVNWRVIWVDVEAALNEPDESSCGRFIERTDKWMEGSYLREFLTNPDHGFITQNGYYDDYTTLRDLGVQPFIKGDSYIYGMMMPTGPRVSKALGNLLLRYVELNEGQTYDKNRWGSWADHEWDGQELSDGAILYCAHDPWASYKIETTLKEEYPRYNSDIYQLEIDLMPVLSRMRYRGVKVHEENFAQSLYEYRSKVGHLQQELNSRAGWVVRTGSNKDLGEYLFDQLKLQPVLWTKGGKTKKPSPSTSKDALAYLNHEDVELIVELKEAESILSNLESMWASEMGDRIEENGVKYRLYHPTFKPISESQGSRIYTENPSVNQWTWEMRKNVVPTQGTAFVYADISAFELILAAYSFGQFDMIEAYLGGQDLHRKEAVKIFGGTEADIDDKKREATKTVEYATIFGSEGASVARKLKCSIEDAQHLCWRFMEVNDKIRAGRDRVHAAVLKTGIAKTPMGRCRRIAEVWSDLDSVKEKGKRKAFNNWCQSGAADIAKKALVWLDNNLPKEYCLFFPVFDSITFCCPDMDPKHKEILDYYMAQAFTLEINGKVWRFLHKSGQGVNWKAAKDDCEKNKVVINPKWRPTQPIQN